MKESFDWEDILMKNINKTTEYKLGSAIMEYWFRGINHEKWI